MKYEDVYLKDYASPRDVRQGLAKYFEFYNNRRIHQSLDYHTPTEIYYKKGRTLSYFYPNQCLDNGVHLKLPATE